MAKLAREDLHRLYYYMRLTRMVEERLTNLAAQAKVIGSLYRSLGQEATAVGSAYALDRARGDVALPILRDLGAVLVMGGRPHEIFQQYMAKGTGPSGGRELNIHFGSPERGFVGPVSMLGDMIPVAAGIALAMKMTGKDSVALCYIGDGGFSAGPVHEGLNFAAVQDVPMILVVENNGWAYSTPTGESTRVTRLADRAKLYGIPGETVDGNDVLAVHEVTSRAVERARSGKGPTLIEAVTYRMKGHAQHDNQSYVAREQLAEWEARDPIARFEAVLKKRRAMSKALMQETVARIEAELDEAVLVAESSPMPEPASAALGAYASSVAPAVFTGD
jgi:pyruvate dehydrogenase E1 component alpha subunit/2-oxoisovalerate dehydrogenase E1 component alpha subunit